MVEPTTPLQQRQALLKWHSSDRYAFFTHRLLHRSCVSSSCSHWFVSYGALQIENRMMCQPHHPHAIITVLPRFYVIRHARDFVYQAPPLFSCALKRSGSLGTRLVGIEHDTGTCRKTWKFFEMRKKKKNVHETLRIEPTSPELLQSPVESQPTEPPGVTAARTHFFHKLIDVTIQY